MSIELLVINLLSPPVLFFLLGLLAVALRSDLELPAPIPKLLSLYLLMAIGIKGGVALAKSPLTGETISALSLGVLLAFAVPIWAYALARRRLSPADAAATAAAYGSVSAVTFIAATSFLDASGLAYGGHMVAALALMESPAIMVALLIRRIGERGGAPLRLGPIVHEAMTGGSVVLLLGSLLIGIAAGPKGAADLAPFTQDLFKGMLCLFLLDMGIVAGRRLRDLRRLGGFLIRFAVGLPLFNAALTIGLARLAGLAAGDAILLVTLAASASYIAVPATMRLAIPEANPGVYLTLALALTFPFNLVIGLPLYAAAVKLLW